MFPSLTSVSEAHSLATGLKSACPMSLECRPKSSPTSSPLKTTPMSTTASTILESPIKTYNLTLSQSLYFFAVMSLFGLQLIT